MTKAVPTVVRRIQGNTTDSSGNSVFEMTQDWTYTVVGAASASTWIIPKQWGCTNAQAVSAQPAVTGCKRLHFFVSHAVKVAAAAVVEEIGESPTTTW